MITSKTITNSKLVHSPENRVLKGKCRLTNSRSKKLDYLAHFAEKRPDRPFFIFWQKKRNNKWSPTTVAFPMCGDKFEMLPWLVILKISPHTRQSHPKPDIVKKADFRRIILPFNRKCFLGQLFVDWGSRRNCYFSTCPNPTSFHTTNHQLGIKIIHYRIREKRLRRQDAWAYGYCDQSRSHLHDLLVHPDHEEQVPRATGPHGPDPLRHQDQELAAVQETLHLPGDGMLHRGKRLAGMSL